MPGRFKYSFSPNDLYLLIATLLMQYDAEKEFLEVAKTDEEKEDTRNGMRVIGQAVKILVQDYHTSKRFMIMLQKFCDKHGFIINSQALISDIIAGRYEKMVSSKLH
ncbi:MAG: hypothetical protein HYT93_04325 [Parcubacteria group bacterium]|nr:hypothetical protein [Parcubacteria group bacterium]